MLSDHPIITTIAWSGYRELEDACHVVNGRLLCDSCGHRIPTKAHSEFYQPKYPFCPWCGAKVLNGRYVRRDA